MWYEFFLVFGLWWWIALAIELVALTCFVVNEEGGRAFWAIAIYLVVMNLFGDMNLFSWLKSHPLDLLRYAGIYLALGALWSLVKLIAAAHDLKEKWNKEREKWIDNYTSDLLTAEEKQSAWMDHIRGNSDYRVPRFNDYTERIIFWISYWPISFMWSVLSDFLTKLGRQVFRLVSGIWESVFNRVTRSIFDEVEKAKTSTLAPTVTQEGRTYKKVETTDSCNVGFRA